MTRSDSGNFLSIHVHVHVKHHHSSIPNMAIFLNACFIALICVYCQTMIWWKGGVSFMVGNQCCHLRHHLKELRPSNSDPQDPRVFPLKLNILHCHCVVDVGTHKKMSHSLASHVIELHVGFIQSWNYRKPNRRIKIFPVPWQMPFPMVLGCWMPVVVVLGVMLATLLLAASFQFLRLLVLAVSSFGTPAGSGGDLFLLAKASATITMCFAQDQYQSALPSKLMYWLAQ